MTPPTPEDIDRAVMEMMSRPIFTTGIASLLKLRKRLPAIVGVPYYRVATPLAVRAVRRLKRRGLIRYDRKTGWQRTEGET